MAVKISIEKQCLVNIHAIGGTASDAVLDFGAHGILDKAVDAETPGSGGTALTVTCTKGTDYEIELDAGRYPAIPGDPATRRMKFGEEFISYTLSTDSERAEVWAYGNHDGQTLTTRGYDDPMTAWVVYGRVPPQKTPSAGVYTDTVGVMVKF